MQLLVDYNRFRAFLSLHRLFRLDITLLLGITENCNCKGKNFRMHKHQSDGEKEEERKVQMNMISSSLSDGPRPGHAIARSRGTDS